MSGCWRIYPQDPLGVAGTRSPATPCCRGGDQPGGPPLPLVLLRTFEGVAPRVSGPGGRPGMFTHIRGVLTLDDAAVRRRYLRHIDTLRGRVRTAIVRRRLAEVLSTRIDDARLRVYGRWL